MTISNVSAKKKQWHKYYYVKAMLDKSITFYTTKHNLLH